MASETTQPNEPSAHEMAVHARDYDRFTTMFKWGAIVSFLTAMIVLIFVL